MTQICLAVGDYNGDIEKRLKYLSSGSVFEILSDSFMQEYTHHKNFTDFCEAIGCDMTSQSDLDKLQDTNTFDEAIHSNSVFSSWKEMLETAYQILIDKK